MAQADPAPAEPAPLVAQAEPAPVSPEAPPPAPLPTFEPAPVVTGPSAPQPVVQATAPEEEPALAQPEPVAEPKPEKPVAPALKIGIGVRTGLALSVNDPSDDVKFSLDDGIGDELLIRPYFSGQLTKNIGVVANFQITENRNSSNNMSVGFAVLDAILQLKMFDELQLWIGQHIPANDRNNFCGPFFHNSWNFAINVPSYPFDVGARDRGFTFWGLIAGGIVKYHLSMVDLQLGRSIENSRFAGRLTINLLDPENYYYASGSYYGTQDVLAIGGVVSYQKGVGSAIGSTSISADVNGDGDIDNDFLGGSIDLLFEKRLGPGGVITLEAGYWNFEGVGADYLVNQGTANVGNGISGFSPGQAMLVGVSWLAAQKTGIGQLQPNFRVQWADYDGSGPTPVPGEGEHKVYDFGLAYIIDGFNHKWNINYRHGDTPAGKLDQIQFGAQMQL